MDKKWFKLNISQIETYCRKYHIISFALFGSILTSGFNKSSDVDILVNFDVNHMPTLFGIVDMEFELSSIIGWPVDLKTPEDLSPYFRNDVVAHAEVIYNG
ncbi:MAG: nucleotidyltransferase domain-containing protein [Chlamydiota bacterium]